MSEIIFIRSFKYYLDQNTVLFIVNTIKVYLASGKKGGGDICLFVCGGHTKVTLAIRGRWHAKKHPTLELLSRTWRSQLLPFFLFIFFLFLFQGFLFLGELEIGQGAAKTEKNGNQETKIIAY